MISKNYFWNKQQKNNYVGNDFYVHKYFLSTQQNKRWQYILNWNQLTIVNNLFMCVFSLSFIGDQKLDESIISCRNENEIGKIG